MRLLRKKWMDGSLSANLAAPIANLNNVLMESSFLPVGLQMEVQ